LKKGVWTGKMSFYGENGQNMHQENKKTKTFIGPDGGKKVWAGKGVSVEKLNLIRYRSVSG